MISNNRRKDGTYPVKIRVTFKGVSRRLATAMVCKPTDLTRSLKIKNADILSQADKIIIQDEGVIKEVSPHLNWRTRMLIGLSTGLKTSCPVKEFRLDFFEWGQKVIKQKSHLQHKGCLCQSLECT